KGDFADPGANQGSLIADQHHFITIDDLQCTHQVAIALVDHHGDHTLATATAARKLFQQCPLAVAALGCRQNLYLRLRNDHGHQSLAFGQTHAPYAPGSTSHRADMLLFETHHLTAIGEQHDITGTICDSRRDQGVVLIQTHSEQAIAT